jgi:hypothetical protein
MTSHRTVPLFGDYTALGRSILRQTPEHILGWFTAGQHCPLGWDECVTWRGGRPPHRSQSAQQLPASQSPPYPGAGSARVGWSWERRPRVGDCVGEPIINGWLRSRECTQKVVPGATSTTRLTVACYMATIVQPAHIAVHAVATVLVSGLRVEARGLVR